MIGDKRIRHITRPTTLNYIPTSEYGKNGDTVYVKDEKTNSTEEFIKQDGAWISLITGRGALDPKRRAGKKGTTTASATTIQNITVNQAAGTSGSGTAASTTFHGDLQELSDDDHTIYVHNSIARTITANHLFSGSPQFSGQPSFTKSGTPFSVSSTTKVTNLNADLLDGNSEAAFFKLADNETVTGRPAFNGGATGTSSPFTVDSTDVVTNLNADLWDGNQFASYLDQAVLTTSAPTFATVNTGQGDNELYDMDQNVKTDSAVTFATVNTGQGANELYDMDQNVLTTSAVTFATVDTGQGANELYDMDQNVKTDSDVTFGDIIVAGDDISSDPYTAGFTGSGWKIDNTATAEFSNISVRGTLSVYELLMQQIRATNGNVVITAVGKIKSISGNDLTFEDPKENTSGGDATSGVCPFHTNDIIMVQRANLTGTTDNVGSIDIIRRLVRRVTNVSGATITVTRDGDLPSDTGSFQVGDDVVRIGNTSNTNRDATLYLSADDTKAPYLVIKDGVDSWANWNSADTEKVRLGRLDGITDTTAGLDGNQANKYGLYSDDVYLKGHINATTGKIGGVNLSNSSVYVGSGGYGNASQTFYLGNDGKFSLKDKLKWSGSALEITGDITVTNSGDFADTDADNTASNETFDSTDATRCVVSSTGLEVKNSSSTSLAVFGASMRVGKVADDHSRLEIDSSGNLSIINRQGSTDTTTISLSNAGNASFTGAVTATSGTFTGAVNASSGNITGALTVKDTITVGTASDNGAIKLYGNSGTGGKIHTSGKDTFADGTAGFFLGYDGSSQYDLAIGDGSKYMKWDGSAGTLTIRGTLNADDIVAGTLTGRTVQTASSGTRVVIDGSANTMTMYDGLNKKRVVVDDGNAIPEDQAEGGTSRYYTVDQYPTSGSASNGIGTSEEECDTTYDYGSYKNRQAGARIDFYSTSSADFIFQIKGSSNGSSWTTVWNSGNLSYNSNGSRAIYPVWAITSEYTYGYRLVAYKTHGGGTLTFNNVYWRVFDTFTLLDNGGLNWSGAKIWTRIGMSHLGDSLLDGKTCLSARGTTHLYQDGGGNNDEGNPLVLSNGDSDQYNFQFYFSGNNLNIKDKEGHGGYISGSTDYSVLTFTGQHRCIGNSGMTAEQYGEMVGYIVRADGDYNNMSDVNSPTINESLPVIELSDSNNDKRVFGVISSHEDGNEREMSSGSFVTTASIEEGDERVIVNSLGEGAVWVTNINGNLENGDYITTSTAAGLGQKQSDDILHSYTVAKITQDCDFSTGTNFEHNGQTYKKQFVGCTYHCG